MDLLSQTETIHLNVGDSIFLKTPENPTVNYIWTYKYYPTGNIKITHQYEPSTTQRIGAPDVLCFMIDAISAGFTRCRFEYKRPGVYHAENTKILDIQTTIPIATLVKL